MQVEAFDHVTLPVSDLERSKEFYREISRLREIERPPFNRPGASCGVGPSLWGAKTVFTPRDHPDLQAEPSADAPPG